MINKVTIENFKSIHHMELELGNINIFIGANGCGKTNILEALGVISSAVFGVVDDESLLRRGVRPGVPRLYKTSSKKYAMSPHIAFSAEDSSCFYKVSLLNPLEKPNPQWKYKTERFKSNSNEHKRGVRTNYNPAIGDIPSIMGKFAQGSQESLFFSSLREYAIYNPNTSILRGLSPDVQNRPPVGLSGGGLAEGVQVLLRDSKKNEDIEDALDDLITLFPWVKEIGTTIYASGLVADSVPRQKRMITFTDKFMNIKHNKLTAADASEGILYALFLMTLCLSEKGPRLFAIDNIDQAINPRLIKELVKLLYRWFLDIVPEKQLLCTAHNPALLDGLGIDDERVRLFLVDRNSSGVTVVKRVMITKELIELSKKNKMPLSRLWVEGYLGGGVPNV